MLQRIMSPERTTADAFPCIVVVYMNSNQWFCKRLGRTREEVAARGANFRRKNDTDL